MHLMYTLGPDGKRQYTLKKIVDGEVTKSAHPARFSPDDKYSRHRVTLKKRYGLLMMQQSKPRGFRCKEQKLGANTSAEDKKVLGQ
ncbi:hypothetical protein D0859_05369 [Hortaea werneckii]|uniref:H/ACA ribonucleoprotein complex subunit NOP10 n=1 Tax=Hortaea werneckii TaxID=91943 RepID=A0A3M7IYR9_HORWE|nr:hypothetical protein D0859_05369 [Hortaea werneckii]